MRLIGGIKSKKNEVNLAKLCNLLMQEDEKKITRIKKISRNVAIINSLKMF